MSFHIVYTELICFLYLYIYLNQVFFFFFCFFFFFFWGGGGDISLNYSTMHNHGFILCNINSFKLSV